MNFSFFFSIPTLFTVGFLVISFSSVLFFEGTPFPHIGFF